MAEHTNILLVFLRGFFVCAVVAAASFGGTLCCVYFGLLPIFENIKMCFVQENLSACVFDLLDFSGNKYFCC
jgi:hypothetical protein